MNRTYRPCAFGAATRTIFHAISAIGTTASDTQPHITHAKGSSRSIMHAKGSSPTSCTPKEAAAHHARQRKQPQLRPLKYDNRLRGSRGVDCCITQVSQTNFAVSSRNIRLGSDWISGSANSRSHRPLSLLQYPPFLCHPHAPREVSGTRRRALSCASHS